jgi:hypothetical protein
MRPSTYYYNTYHYFTFILSVDGVAATVAMEMVGYVIIIIVR